MPRRLIGPMRETSGMSARGGEPRGRALRADRATSTRKIVVIVVGRPIGKIGWSWACRLLRLDFFHGYIRTGAYERSATSVRDGRTERPCVESCNRRKVPSRWRQSEGSTWLSLDISAAGDGSGDTHHARVVEDTLRMAQDLLREQLQSGDPYHPLRISARSSAASRFNRLCGTRTRSSPPPCGPCALWWPMIAAMRNTASASSGEFSISRQSTLPWDSIEAAG